jgi:hypothetical protein
VPGRHVLELGCEAAQWSIATHKIGARITALGNSVVQFRHTRDLMAVAAVDFLLVHANAESTRLMANRSTTSSLITAR